MLNLAQDQLLEILKALPAHCPRRLNLAMETMGMMKVLILIT